MQFYNTMQIIIPMSGIGKRFIEAGYIEPKPLIMIEGKPIIEHVVNLFPKNASYLFICNDKHLKETNMRETLKRIVPTCEIFEVSVENRKGPVDAVMQAKHLIDDNDEVIVSYCDYGTQWNYDNFINDAHKHNADGSIACYTGFHPHMLGSDNYAFVQENNMNMIKIQEKKSFTENKMNEYASNGTYYFKNGMVVKKYFQQLINKNISINGEYYVSMVYNLLVEDGLLTRIFKIEKMLQWGTPKDLQEYLVWSNYFLTRNIDFNQNMIDTQNTTLVLPMAGKGSRFTMCGYSTPKPLLHVENEPMVVQAVKCLPPTTNKIFVCQNEHLDNYKIKQQIQHYFENAQFNGIDYVTNGQACTCEIAINAFDINPENPILISACDNGVYYDVDKYNELLNDNNVDVIIWSFSNNPTSKLYPHMYAWLDVDENNYIKRVSIKKPFNDIVNKHAIIGTMLFKKCRYFNEGLKYIYKNNIRTNNEYYVDNLIEPLINMGYKCKIFDVNNYLCWGTPNDYLTYMYWNEYFNAKHV